LIDAGSDLNFKNEFNMTPLRQSLISEHYDVILYLLMKGAEYRKPISKVEGKDRLYKRIKKVLPIFVV
jgi:ankyrin repeat protein